MKRFGFAVALMLTLGSAQADAFTLEMSEGVKKAINVSSDSPQGWLPTDAQRQQALKAAQLFLEALDKGKDEQAYNQLTEINKRQQTRAGFAQEAEKFRTLVGSSKAWKVLKVTWTKDSPRAPVTGIYAAIDLSAVFSNADRHCGYMIMYQRPDGGDFSVMRRENNYLDNVTAKKIEAQYNKDRVEQIWAQLSSQCPNYKALSRAP